MTWTPDATGWEADETPEFDESNAGPEYQMWKKREETLRDIPCKCGYYNTKQAYRCVKCEGRLWGI